MDMARWWADLVEEQKNNFMKEIDRLQEENEKLKAVNKQMLEDLKYYGQHEFDCLMSQGRQGIATDEPGYNGYKMLFGYGKEETWYGRDELPPCSCGLRDAIQAAEREEV